MSAFNGVYDPPDLGNFDEWIAVFEEDVVQGEYGYEPGEFMVFPEHWRPMWERGLTPSEAFKRALDAHGEARREEEAARLANWERIKIDDRMTSALSASEGVAAQVVQPIRDEPQPPPNTGREPR